MVKIALFQSQTGIDPAANAARVVDAIDQAAGEGAAMLFTPEMSGLLDRNSERALGNVRVEDEDPVIAAARNAAHVRGIWVHLGSVAVLYFGYMFAFAGLRIEPDVSVPTLAAQKLAAVPVPELEPPVDSTGRPSKPAGRGSRRGSYGLNANPPTAL